MGDDASGFLQVPTVKANQVVPISPEANVKIQFLNTAAITPPPEWMNTLTLDGHLNIVKDKILSLDDIRKSDTSGYNITVHDTATFVGDVETTVGSASAKYLKTAGAGGLTIRTSNNTDVVKVWDTGLTQFSKPVRFDDAVTV